MHIPVGTIERETLAAPPAANTGSRSGAGRTFFIPLLLFLASYLAVNVFLSTSFHADEAEQILFSQSLDAGYEAQPPLYSWLLQLFFAAFGLSFFAFAILKALILGAVFVGLYLSARKMLNDDGRASLAAFSIFLIPLFAWSALGYLTHTILLAAACTGTCYAVLRLQDGREWASYALLGLMLGLGALTKYNYVLFAGALFVAGLSIRSYRSRLLDRRMLLALAIAAALTWPHAVYLAGHWESIAQLLRGKAEVGTFSRQGAGKAASDLVTNIVLILAPLTAAGVLFFPQVLRRMPKAGTEHVTGAPFVSAAAERKDANLVLLERYLLVLVGLLLLVIAGGAKRFNDRWLHPFALVAPLYLFGRLRGITIPSWRLKGFAFILVVGGAVLIGIRTGQLLLGGSPSCPYALNSFTEAAGRLRAELGPHATTVASQRALCGNLCYWLPDMRHLCCERPTYLPGGRTPQGKFAVIWDAVEGDALPPALQAFVAHTWHVRVPGSAPARVLDVRSARGHDEHLRYIVLPAAADLSARSGLVHFASTKLVDGKPVHGDAK